MAERRADRRVVALGALWLAVSAGVFAVQGCYGRICEQSFGFYGTRAGEGRMIDENTWESVPVDGDWHEFPGARSWIFEIPALSGRKPYDIHAYVSADRAPNRSGHSSTTGGGNIAEIYNVNNDRVDVRNGTCAEYFLRIVVRVAPFPPAPPVQDAGTD